MDSITKIKRFRVDLLGLSTDTKPTDVPNGSTFIEVDTSKYYIFWSGSWYEQNAEETNEQTPNEETKELIK